MSRCLRLQSPSQPIFPQQPAISSSFSTFFHTSLHPVLPPSNFPNVSPPSPASSSFPSEHSPPSLEHYSLSLPAISALEICRDETKNANTSGTDSVLYRSKVLLAEVCFRACEWLSRSEQGAVSEPEGHDANTDVSAGGAFLCLVSELCKQATQRKEVTMEAEMRTWQKQKERNNTIQHNNTSTQTHAQAQAQAQVCLYSVVVFLGASAASSLNVLPPDMSVEREEKTTGDGRRIERAPGKKGTTKQVERILDKRGKGEESRRRGEERRGEESRRRGEESRRRGEERRMKSRAEEVQEGNAAEEEGGRQEQRIQEEDLRSPEPFVD
eukprot:757389-Hanusia_phi.AAC.1